MMQALLHRVIPPPSVFPVRVFLLVVLVAALAGCGKNAEERLRERSGRTDRAQALLAQGQYAAALAELKELLGPAPEPGMDSVLAVSRYIAGQCAERLGHYEEALADYKSSTEYARGISDQRLERLNKFSLARFYFATGDYGLARTLASQAAAAARVFADSSILYDALLLAADADGRAGEVDRSLRAITDLERMVPDAPGSDRRIALMELRFATLFRAGRNADIRETLSRWRMGLGGAPEKRSLMMAAYCAGRFQDRLAHPDSALAFFSEALTLFEEPADPLFATNLLTQLGNVAYELHHFADAQRYYTDALGRSTAAGNGIQESMLKLGIAACDWNIGKRSPGGLKDGLFARCTAVLSECRERRMPDGTALALYLLAMFTEQGGSVDSAQILYRSALAVAQSSSFRSWEPSPLQRMTEVILAGERAGWHTPLIRLAAQLRDVPAVFEAIEQKTLDDIGSFFLESSVRPPDDALRTTIEELRWKRRLAARSEQEIESELALGRAGNPERLAALQEASPLLAADADKASNAFNTSPSNLRWILTVRGLPLRAVQDTLAPGAALLEYAVTPKSLAITVVKHDTVILRTVAIEKENLLGMVSEYNRIIGDEKISNEGAPVQSAAAVRRMGDLAAQLANVLVDPVMADLRHADTLYIVSPLEFGWLAFHTLGTEGEGGRSSAPLLERFTVRYLPSAAMLFCARPPERFVQRVVGFGHPGSTNWDVEYELKDIRSFYDKARMLFDTAATVARLSQLDADVIHIAAEFSLAASGPDRSTVLFSDGNTPYGLSRVPLGTLAALPPPQTLLLSSIAAEPGALNRYVPALFLAGGTRTVITTMWRGDRKAKRYFGEIFYTNLTTGLPAGDAYRSAALALMRKSEYAAPQRWGLYFQFGR